MDINSFKKLPLMGIVRGVGTENVAQLIKTVMESGLETIEITMNTPGAGELIKMAKKTAAGRMSIGAGTVLSSSDMKTAIDAGASFIVMPVNVPDVTAYCSKEGIPVFPGAFTPQEVFDAWEAGASMVKVFPSGMFGPKYIKELKGPLDKVKLMAVGGVRPDNVSEYFTCGADAVAFGGSVFSKDRLAAKDFNAIKTDVKALVDAVKKAVSFKL